jgi:hypothetical protein
MNPRVKDAPSWSAPPRVCSSLLSVFAAAKNALLAFFSNITFSEYRVFLFAQNGPYIGWTIKLYRWGPIKKNCDRTI